MDQGSLALDHCEVQPPESLPAHHNEATHQSACKTARSAKSDKAIKFLPLAAVATGQVVISFRPEI